MSNIIVKNRPKLIMNLLTKLKPLSEISYDFKIVGFILSVTLTLSLIIAPSTSYATEFRSVASSGLDAQSISIGNVTSFGSTALSVLETPAIKLTHPTELSLYYATMMESDVRLFAGGIHHQATPRLSVGFGVVTEQINAGYETASANSEVTEVSALTYSNNEYAINTSYKVTRHLTAGLTGRYIHREEFGITGTGYGLSTGLRYETNRFGLSLGANNLNSPKIHYTNNAQETLYGTWYAGVKTSFYALIPITFYGQYNWVPHYAVAYTGTGLRFQLTQHLSLNAGRMQVRSIERNIHTQTTIGASLALDFLSLHYAFTTSEYTEDPIQNRLTVSFKF